MIDAAIRAAVTAALEPLVEQVRQLRAVVEQRGAAEPLLPLCEILGCSTRAASMRIRRTPALRALGLPVGRGRLVYRREAVEQYMRSIGGGR